MIQETDDISEQDCANIVKQLLLGLNYLHSQNIWHCDLKLENVMVELEEGEDGESTNFICKITDFGFV